MGAADVSADGASFPTVLADKSRAVGSDLVVEFEGDDDSADPQTWSLGYKVYLTVLYAQCCLLGSAASTIYAPGASAVASQFGVSEIVANLGTSLFSVGYACGSPIFAPLSEWLGRRRPFLVGFFIFDVVSIMSAVAQNLETVMLGRWLQGIFAVCPIIIAPGVFVDIFGIEGRSNAMILYTVLTVSGVALGPVIGTFIVVNDNLGWRWTEFMVVIWSSTLFLLALLTLRETYAPVILQEKARRLRFETKNWALHSSLDEQVFSFTQAVRTYLLRPFAMLLREPILSIVTTYHALCYGLIFGCLEVVPYVFSDLRGWSTGSSGLVFLALVVGSLVAAVITYGFSRRYLRVMALRRTTSVPDERCLPLAVGGVALPTGLFLLGWTAPQYVASGWPEVLGIFFIGLAFSLILLSAWNLLIDCYASYANSALGANTIVRSLVAAGFPLFSRAMFANLGVEWASTLLGCISLLLLPFPPIFRRYSRQLLAKSRYAQQSPTLSQSQAVCDEEKRIEV